MYILQKWRRKTTSVRRRLVLAMILAPDSRVCVAAPPVSVSRALPASTLESSSPPVIEARDVAFMPNNAPNGMCMLLGWTSGRRACVDLERAAPAGEPKQRGPAGGARGGGEGGTPRARARRWCASSRGRGWARAVGGGRDGAGGGGVRGACASASVARWAGEGGAEDCVRLCGRRRGRSGRVRGGGGVQRRGGVERKRMARRQHRDALAVVVCNGSEEGGIVGVDGRGGLTADAGCGRHERRRQAARQRGLKRIQV
ncbi:hypothetical protein FB451DRAFT_1440125 [Mycena latifolia]|nr:hypothetical protein FB451DRAFT_1440125 [Mycena latifolia]